MTARAHPRLRPTCWPSLLAAVLCFSLGLGCGGPSSDPSAGDQITGDSSSIRPADSSRDGGGTPGQEGTVTPADGGGSSPEASTKPTGAFSFVSVQANPTKLTAGGSVTLSIKVQSNGSTALSNGQIWVESKCPDGRTFMGKTTGISISAGVSSTATQVRGPYTVLGTWVFTATLRDASEAVLASGPNNTVSVTVEAAPKPSTLKVLVYAGSDAGPNCVQGTLTSMDKANQNNYVPGLKFTYKKTTVVNSSTLAGYQVLAMPGGSGGSYYLHNSNISGSAIKAFVSAGGGYYGTCAGAYAAAAHTDGYYDGWGIAPNVYAKAVTYEGMLQVTFTADGTTVLGQSGTKTWALYNGAAMYKSPATGPAVILANFASTAWAGRAAVVTDTYGSGRTILVGPHPELDPQFPTVVTRMIAWAGKAL